MRPASFGIAETKTASGSGSDACRRAIWAEKSVSPIMKLSSCRILPPRSVKRCLKNLDSALVKSMDWSVHRNTVRAPSLSKV